MITVLYEDEELIVAVKPAGYESQTARRFAPDMVSEIKKYLVINKLCTAGREPYVAVVHRLDKPVSGVMVYARTKDAAAALSRQVRDGRMHKTYHAVVCGKPEKEVDNYVDYLKKSVDKNTSVVVDKGITGAKRAELSYRVIDVRDEGTDGAQDGGEHGDGLLSLLEVDLKTGRHHQIRVQLAAHGTPVWGDTKYGPAAHGGPMTPEAVGPAAPGGVRPAAPGDARPVVSENGGRGPLALCATSLSFLHPKTGERMRFSIRPSGGAFEKFSHWE